MKILVAVKAVATLDEDFELGDDDRAVDPDYLEHELNGWDDVALEAALQLVETGSGEVVVVTIGDDEAEEALMTCLAKGADRAIRVWDDALEGADVLAVARVLAAVVARESPELVLCGAQSADAGHSATGVAAAGFLGLRHAAVIRRLAPTPDGGGLTIERELEGGVIEVATIALPALLTVQTGTNTPRYATLRSINQAREKPLQELDLDDLDLDAGALAAVAGSETVALRRPEASEPGEMLEGSVAEIAADIQRIVRDRLAS